MSTRVSNKSTKITDGELPSDQNDWLKKLIQEVEGDIARMDADRESKDIEIPNLALPVQELKDLIETDSKVYMFFHQMFSHVPKQPPYDKRPQVRNYRVMLHLINHIMTCAPEYNDTELASVPIYAILICSMATPGGHAAFLDDKVNACFKKILNFWGNYLKSADSCSVLNKTPSGWFGKPAMDAMPDFEKEFKCHPQKPHYGYTSWDDFFTREYRDGIREVAAPDNDKVIANACESSPYDLQTNVKLRDRFWVKSQPYSLFFMLANDPLSKKFVGGTIYQAFLSALSYHRWHSPVDGTIVKSYVVDGCYYSQALSPGPDDARPNKSQGYFTEVATRAFIFIEADNPYIGLMCFVAIGMVEVSTCDITVYDGQRVKKGDQTGMFHFGGSTHCLIFQPGVEIEFHLRGMTPGVHNHRNIPVKSKIATVLHGSSKKQRKD